MNAAANDPGRSPERYALLIEWLATCARSEELVSNYNRLRGTSIKFTTRPRTPFEKMIDEACGHVPMPDNKPDEVRQFLDWCRDLFDRLPTPEAKAKAA